MIAQLTKATSPCRSVANGIKDFLPLNIILGGSAIPASRDDLWALGHCSSATPRLKSWGPRPSFLVSNSPLMRPYGGFATHCCADRLGLCSFILIEIDNGSGVHMYGVKALGWQATSYPISPRSVQGNRSSSKLDTGYGHCMNLILPV